MAALHPKDVSMRSVNMRSHLRLVKSVSALILIHSPVTQVCIDQHTFYNSNLLWTMLQLLSRLLVYNKISWVILLVVKVVKKAGELKRWWHRFAQRGSGRPGKRRRKQLLTSQVLYHAE